jgi:hypothetical protein
VTRSRNHCCHGNATDSSFFIVDGAEAAVNHTKVFSGAMEMQQWVPFALRSSYKTLRTAVSNNTY